MSIPRYKVGDTIVMKSGLTRTLTDNRTCTIIGVLPRDHGYPQYRVKFAGENFERRIVEDDVDLSETAPAERVAEQPRQVDGEVRPWLKPLSVRRRK